MSEDRSIVPPARTAVEAPPDDGELPVVARLIVEIRSDGTRTVARGAIEDAITGQRTTVEARGTTPLALFASLTRSLLHVPALARRAARALLPGRTPR